MEWWQEDPELLSATLDLLASTEDEQPAPGIDAVAVPHATVSATPPTPMSFMDVLSSTASSAEDDSVAVKMPEKKTRRVINVSRERRRDETRYLRAKVVELEAQLSILQHRREEMLRPHRSETGEIRSVAAVWEILATRQVHELKRSRQTNDKLKRLVQTQLRVAEDLIAAIRRAEEESRRQCEESDITLSRPRLAIDISQKISQEDQLARLDVLCTQWREAFASTDKFHDGTSLHFLDIELVQDNGVESVVNVFSSSAAPFAKEKVEEVLWRFYLEDFPEEEDGNAFQQDYESRDDDNTIIGVFRALSTIENHRTTFEGKYVGRRVRCPQGHMMIISHMYSEPRCKSKLLEDVALEEDSWFRVVESHSVGGPKLSHPLTLVQHVRRMHIRFGPSHFEEDGGRDELSPTRRRAGALTEFLMLQIQDEMKQGEQCIENMLLDNFNTMSLTPTPNTSGGHNVIV